MARGIDWEKANRREMLAYRPAPRALPATQKQLDYIVGLAYQKGQPKPRLPKTRHGAGELIDRLLALPDVNERMSVKLAPVETPRDTLREETMVALRQRFPKMTPMTVNSLLQLLSQIDEIGMLFFFHTIIADEEAPEALDELIPFILQRFVEEFC